MLPEQIPGTLFVLLVAWVGMAAGQELAVLVLAVGCAAGWLSFHPIEGIKAFATLIALALWALGFLMILLGVL